MPKTETPTLKLRKEVLGYIQNEGALGEVSSPKYKDKTTDLEYQLGSKINMFGLKNNYISYAKISGGVVTAYLIGRYVYESGIYARVKAYLCRRKAVETAPASPVN